MAKSEPCERCSIRTTGRTISGRPLCSRCKHGKGTYERVTPLSAGKPLAPTRAAPAPGYAKFKDTPGQQMLSLDDDDPERLDPA